MQAAIEIPTPNDSDSDTVATALETAAVFSAKGDTAEALRWVQRAAESAGEAGDDLRTLTLARTAADMTLSLKSMASTTEPAGASSNGGAARRLPKPPLRESPSPLGASTRTTDEDESGVLSRRPEPARSVPPSSARPTSTQPPPAPSARVTSALSRPRASAVASGIAGTASVASRPPTSGSSKPSTPSIDRRRQALPSPSSASGGPRTDAEATTPTSERIRASSSDTSNADVTSSAPELPADAPPPVSAAAQPRTEGLRVRDAAEAIPTPKPAASASVRPPESAKPGTGLRTAARVSVIASSTEPGLYFVRLLGEGTPPPSSATEAVMVLLDPSSTLFSG